ncbi:hypothetical protein GE061_018454 [Apolygus lucorum]|uniref:Uncharacterized protein n=1 Tax=Apolygus lucorum TaxID=248454 RepID=A0A8S9XFA4_APOLU|nr:hypothetical protein GE061_018454 [Apolygus lucorum]
MADSRLILFLYSFGNPLLHFYAFWLDLFIIYIFPLAAMTICNTTIIIKLKIASKTRREITSQQDLTAHEERDKRLTIMLVLLKVHNSGRLLRPIQPFSEYSIILSNARVRLYSSRDRPATEGWDAVVARGPHSPANNPGEPIQRPDSNPCSEIFNLTSTNLHVLTVKTDFGHQ